MHCLKLEMVNLPTAVSACPFLSYSYPNFLNLLTTGAYIPISFAYVIPAINAGWIGQDQFDVPKRDFAVRRDVCFKISQIYSNSKLVWTSRISLK